MNQLYFRLVLHQNDRTCRWSIRKRKGEKIKSTTVSLNTPQTCFRFHVDVRRAS